MHTSSASWTLGSQKSAYAIVPAGQSHSLTATPSDLGVSLYVIPQSLNSVNLSFSLDGTQKDLPLYNADNADLPVKWEAGKEYIYNVVRKVVRQ